MLNSLKLYKVLSYILIVLAFLFAFMDTVFLMSALANPSALIFVFALACFVIYAFASFRFLRQGVEREQILPKKSKDWIKVNAYVSLFLCSLFFLNSASVLMSSNSVLIKVAEEFIDQQSGLPAGIDSRLMLQVMKGASVFLLVTGIVGLLHIRTTLRLVKQYDYLFE